MEPEDYQDYHDEEYLRKLLEYAREQEYVIGGWAGKKQWDDSELKEYLSKMMNKKTKFKSVEYKVGDLVKRKSSVARGTVGVITRVDEIVTNKYHGKKYLVTFQQDGRQVWLHADQLEHFGNHPPREG